MPRERRKSKERSWFPCDDHMWSMMSEIDFLLRARYAAASGGHWRLHRNRRDSVSVEGRDY